MKMRHPRTRHLVAATLICGLLAAPLPAAARPSTAGGPIVLTGTTFPAGFGVGVAADTIGLQAALWTPLVGFTDKLLPFAGLITRVPQPTNGDVRISGGTMQVTLHLKPNLRFSDGSPLTADDVVFGLGLERDVAIGNSFGLDEIAHAAALDAHTVVLQFADLYGAYLAYAMPPALPRAYFQHKYQSTDLHTLALAYARDAYNSPTDVFSGPYKIGSVAPGQRITLIPNPYFSALAATPAASRPELRYVVVSNDESALARALHARQAGVDLALGFGPASLPLLQGLSRQGMHLVVQPSLAVEHLELNQANPALRDLRVRQALQAAIDKRALARAVFPTIPHPETLVATSLIPAASPFHDRTIVASVTNPATARALLHAAGYATALNGPGKHLTLDLVTINDPTRQREADVLVHAWAAVGVRVTPHLASGSAADRGGFYAPYDLGGVLATRHFDLALFDLRQGPDPASVAALFDPGRIPTGLSRGVFRRNYIGIDVEALAMLPETAQASLDPITRSLGYARLQVKVNALLPFIVLYERPQIVVESGKIHTLKLAPQDAADLWNSWEWAR